MSNQEPKVRINTTVEGDAARQLLELKRRGICSSNKDAFVQAIRLFYKSVIQSDIMEQRVKNVGDEFA